MNDSEILKKAIADGIIDIESIHRQIEMNERKKYLDMHTHRIWEGNGNWYTYLYNNNSRRLIKRKKLEDLEDIIVEHYKSEVQEPTIFDIFKKWINDKFKYGEIQQQTYNRYYNDFKRFIIGSNIDCKMRCITEDMLEKFIRSTIHDYQLTAKAWGNLRTLLYGIFKCAKKEGCTDISITAFIGDLDLSKRVFKVNRKTNSQQVFTSYEMEQVCNYILDNDTSNGGLGIIFAFYTGLRAGELSALTWSDIDDCIHVNKTEINYKTDKGMVYEVRDFPKTEASIRDVVLTEDAKIILDKLRTNMDTSREANNYIFTKGGNRIHAHVFSNKLKRICKKLGIEPKSIHKCRKTYASILANAKVSETILTSQLGHTNINTTRQYYIFDNYDFDETREIIQDAFK